MSQYLPNSLLQEALHIFQRNRSRHYRQLICKVQLTLQMMTTTRQHKPFDNATGFRVNGFTTGGGIRITFAKRSKAVILPSNTDSSKMDFQEEYCLYDL